MSEICSHILKEIKEKYEVVDLFSGCGGFSYGFKQSGFNVAFGIDIEKPAASTASYNLHWKDGIMKDHVTGDVTKLQLEEILEQTDFHKNKIVIGGPPCQAYSQIGKAKLRSLGEDRIHTNDERGMLYESFVDKVISVDAELAVMENVLESVNYGGENIPENVCRILEAKGYSAKWTLLNAADFGVPQVRERVFVFASKKRIIDESILPSPTHQSTYGRTAQGSKRVKKFMESEYFMGPKKPGENLPYWRTVNDALSDLPVLFSSPDKPYFLHPVNTGFNYSAKPSVSYQKLMRKNNTSNMVTGNCFRKTVRDFRIFDRMKPGDNYLDASDIADDLFHNYCASNDIRETDPSYSKVKKQFVPPYSRTKFKDKWKKLNPELPSHTLVAHLSTDTYSHIHPWEPRGISVREAARLQSFPDDFVFRCTMSDAFKQIGNAVPPLLAQALSDQILNWMTVEETVKQGEKSNATS